MKPVRSLALLLLACTLVGMGFFLPWLGAAWQDAAMEQTTTQYEVTPPAGQRSVQPLETGGQWIHRVRTIGGLPPGCPPAQTETAAVAALYDMDNLGLHLSGAGPSVLPGHLAVLLGQPLCGHERRQPGL